MKPASHVQSDGAAFSKPPVEFGGHCSHALAADEALYCFPAHGRHDKSFDTWALYVPASQGRHLEAKAA